MTRARTEEDGRMERRRTRATLYRCDGSDGPLSLDVDATIGDDGVVDVVWCVSDGTRDVVRINDLPSALCMWNTMVGDDDMLYDSPYL